MYKQYFKLALQSIRRVVRKDETQIITGRDAAL